MRCTRTVRRASPPAWTTTWPSRSGPRSWREALKRVRARSAEHGRGGERRTGSSTRARSRARELGGDEFLTEVVDTFSPTRPTLARNLRRGVERGRRRRISARGAHPEVNGETSVPTVAGLVASSSNARRTASSTAPPSFVDADRARIRARSEALARCAGGGVVSAPVAPGTILVVDDNRVNRLLLGRGLEQRATPSSSPRTAARRSSCSRQRRSTWCCSTSRCPSSTATRCSRS